MLWTESADDCAFLRELSCEIIAAVAPAELAFFDVLIARYFANPYPPRSHPWSGAFPVDASGRASLTPVVPAVLSAMLTLLLMEVQEEAQNDQPAVVKLGLKRLFRQRGADSLEQVRLSAADKNGPRKLSLIVYMYTQPVGISVALSRLVEVAYQTASIYGLDEVGADVLVPAMIARLSYGPSAL